MGQIGGDLRWQAWAGQLIDAELNPGVHRSSGCLAAKAKQQVPDRQSTHAGDLDLQPVHRFLERTQVNMSCSEFDHERNCARTGAGRSICRSCRDVGRKGADEAAGGGKQPGETVAVYAVDPADRAHGLDADRHGVPPLICEADFQPRPSHPF